MFDRLLETKVRTLWKKFPLVGILGPRQSGKTTLAKKISPNSPYVNLEALDVRTAAKDDPRGFLSHYREGVILDEIQNVPELFSYLQILSDEKVTPGQYLLTGSHNFSLVQTITQSLAGRIALTTLLPLSMGELKAKEEADSLIFKGFYPRLWRSAMAPADFYGSYITTYVERDLGQLLRIADLSTFQRFLKLCAGQIGQLLNLSSLSTECGISQATAQRWLSLLQASYIIFLLQPFHENFNKRQVKSPKLYFYDTGLLCHLLGLNSFEQVENHYLSGELFENLLISDITKTFYAQGITPTLYFWRNKNGVEIDLIIERNGALQAIEIKSSRTLHSHFFKNLHYWFDLTRQTNGMLIYGGDFATNQNNVQVVPWDKFSLYL
ncbi:MAG: ATP-binding protein [Puniceicoccales bacterium]|jgi:predicted AAA+ superfamily ATPase|nr:ATP-binding protein [Puniceicoccales bacterium]